MCMLWGERNGEDRKVYSLKHITVMRLITIGCTAQRKAESSLNHDPLIPYYATSSRCETAVTRASTSYGSVTVHILHSHYRFSGSCSTTVYLEEVLRPANTNQLIGNPRMQKRMHNDKQEKEGMTYTAHTPPPKSPSTYSHLVPRPSQPPSQTPHSAPRTCRPKPHT